MVAEECVVCERCPRTEVFCCNCEKGGGDGDGDGA